MIGIPAAYPAGRWQYRGSNDVMFTILSFRFAPELMVIVPLYTRRRAFMMVALPLVRPGIAASALLAFVFAWNNYVFPLILTGSRHTPVTVAVTRFLGGGGQAYYNLTAAAALIAALPPLLVALSIQRYLVRNLSFGAVKA
ncbi:MAG TPA: ABC transporter permease subunit [Pseudonocardia sp.]|nr:ABC transporter permease subunit [Pseudonocardia sp.]